MKYYKDVFFYEAVGGLLLIFVLLFAIPLQSVCAEDEFKNGAKTPPPPLGTLGAFDSNHKYLDDGYSILTHLGDGKIEVVGITKGIGYIDTLGVQMKLQKWTGETWIDIYTSSSFIDLNARLLEATVNRTVETGYYYRIISIHWAEQDGIREEGIRTGLSALIK